MQIAVNICKHMQVTTIHSDITKISIYLEKKNDDEKVVNRNYYILCSFFFPLLSSLH